MMNNNNKESGIMFEWARPQKTSNTSSTQATEVIDNQVPQAVKSTKSVLYVVRFFNRKNERVLYVSKLKSKPTKQQW